MNAALRLSAGIDRLNTLIGRSVYWLILVAVLVSTINAIVRKAFDVSSNAWLELQWQLFGAVFMLCAAYTFLKNEHIRIDIINSRLDDNSGDGLFIGGEGALMGRITGNAIVNTLTGDAIRIDTDAVANATSTILIQNNLINNIGTGGGGDGDGIQVLHRDGAKTLNLTIDGNTITNTASEGVRIFVDDTEDRLRLGMPATVTIDPSAAPRQTGPDR